MRGFHEGLNIVADTVGQALTALLKERCLLITSQQWANTEETKRVFDQIGRLIDSHLETGDHITLTFVEAHRRTNPILSLDTLDEGLLLDQLFGLLTHRVIILEADKLGLTTSSGVYDIGVYATALYIGTMAVWTKR